MDHSLVLQHYDNILLAATWVVQSETFFTNKFDFTFVSHTETPGCLFCGTDIDGQGEDTGGSQSFEVIEAPYHSAEDQTYQIVSSSEPRGELYDNLKIKKHKNYDLNI